MTKAATGGQSQFTYDFGIAIAQGTVQKVVALTGASLTLASAFYALNGFAKEYVGTLKQSAIFFGGYANTLKTMEDAQRRLISGVTSFSVDDQLKGMNRLMAAGVNVRKNFDFINKGAHALGSNFSEFSGAISAGIQGNMGALVDMGLITQRAVRMFEKYPANTIMREQAIMGFVQKHRGLQALIKNDFQTIQGQMMSLKETWNVFLKAVVGDPRDKSSFYGQVVGTLKMITEAFARNVETIKRSGYMIGKVLGWVFRQIGHIAIWVGKKINDSIWFAKKTLDNYKENTYALLVILEFWKVRVIRFLKEYKGLILGIIKVLLIMKATNMLFNVGAFALAPLIKYGAKLKWLYQLQKRYAAATGAGGGMSVAAFLPRNIRRFWIFMGKGLANFGVMFRAMYVGGLKGFGTSFMSLYPKLAGFFTGLGTILMSGVTFLGSFLTNLPAILAASWQAIAAALAAIPGIGWIAAAIIAVGVLYWKVKGFRDFVNQIFIDFWGMTKSYFGFLWSAIKLVWSVVKWLWVHIKGATAQIWTSFKSMWNWSALVSDAWKLIKGFFNLFGIRTEVVGKWVSKMWAKFKDNSVVKWITNLLKPLTDFFNKFTSLFDLLKRGFDWASKGLSGASAAIDADAKNWSTTYGNNGFGSQTPGTVPLKAVAAKPSGSTQPRQPTNPLMAVKQTQQSSPMGDDQMENTGSTSMSFSKGAIQITVQKGEGIDENKLARKIREVLTDMERTNNKRRGN